MNFLSPAYLLALAAVAVPILIHIFSRRRVPEVPFSTIRFLNRSDRRSMVRINVRRLLLLFLRILAVALLALVFARPLVRGGLAALFPAGGSRSACILLDRSYSMGVEGDGGTAFERGKARLASILDNLDKEDAVSLVLFDTAQEIVYNGELEKEVILGAVKGAKPSWSGTDLRGAVARGMRTLEDGRREVRELYIISDFQKTALTRAPSGRSRPETRRRAELPVRAFFLPIQTPAVSNVAVEEVLTPRVALHKGETAELKAVLRNTSRELSARFPLEVSVGGRRIMEKEIEIPPNSFLTERVTFPPDRVGWIEGVVKKRADRLQADDTRFFTLHVQEKVRALLLADEGSFYLEQALSPSGAESDIAAAKKGWRTFTTNDLKASEVLVLGPGRGPEPGDLDLIDRFVLSGGKAIVLVLPELKAAALRLSRFPLRFEFAEMPQGFFSIMKQAAPPSFLAPFGEEDLAALSRLRFRKAALVSGVPAGVALLKFTTGNPLVWEEKRGEGIVVFAAVDPRPEAGEMVLSPFFLPLVQQLVLATGVTSPASEGSLVGSPIVWKGEEAGEIICRLPDGRSLKPEQIETGSPPGRDKGILVPSVEMPGFVTVFDGAEVRGKIAINPDCREESDLAFMPAKAAADSLGLSSRLVVEEDKELSPALHSAREGREISLPLLLAAIALFVIEGVVAQRDSSNVKGGAEQHVG